jgi:hypothetical protein
VQSTAERDVRRVLGALLLAAVPFWLCVNYYFMGPVVGDVTLTHRLRVGDVVPAAYFAVVAAWVLLRPATRAMVRAVWGAVVLLLAWWVLDAHLLEGPVLVESHSFGLHAGDPPGLLVGAALTFVLWRWHESLPAITARASAPGDEPSHTASGVVTPLPVRDHADAVDRQAVE